MTFVLPDLRELEYPQFGPEGGLVGAWSPALSGATGLTLYDLSGRRNHGTLTNQIPDDWMVKNGCMSLQTNVVSKHIDIPHNAAHTPSAFTVHAWINRTGAHHDNGAGIIAKHDGALGYMLFVDSSTNGHIMGMFCNGTNTTNSVAAPLNTLACMTGTFDGATCQFFYDGGVPASQSVSVTHRTTSLTLSRYAGVNSTGLSGFILEAIMFSRVLSAGEVRLLYSLGPGGWAIPRQRRWNALGAAQLTSIAAKYYHYQQQGIS